MSKLTYAEFPKSTQLHKSLPSIPPSFHTRQALKNTSRKDSIAIYIRRLAKKRFKVLLEKPNTPTLC